MADKRQVRAEIDFRLIPKLFYMNKDAFSMTFLNAPQRFLAQIYNDFYKRVTSTFFQRAKYFSEKDFSVEIKTFPSNIKIVYVSLPPIEDRSPVFCTAYALVVCHKDTSFYTIEDSVLGTTCIGTIDEDGNHINYGPAGSSPKENMDILYQMCAKTQPEEMPQRNNFSAEKCQKWVESYCSLRNIDIENMPPLDILALHLAISLAPNPHFPLQDNFYARTDTLIFFSLYALYILHCVAKENGITDEDSRRIGSEFGSGVFDAANVVLGLDRESFLDGTRRDLIRDLDGAIQAGEIAESITKAANILCADMRSNSFVDTFISNGYLVVPPQSEINSATSHLNAHLSAHKDTIFDACERAINDIGN